MQFLERDEHLRSLAGALAQAALGRGRIVAISGEAGAGKTTLVERFTTGQAAAARVFIGACENLSTPEPLLPLRDISRAGVSTLELDRGNLAAFESVLRLLNESAKPALLVLEDVHWADAATLDLIRFLGRRIAKTKALVLATYRDEEVRARSPLRDVLGEAPAGSVQRMALEALSLQAVNAIATQAGRQGEDIYRLTGGNPFLVTEVLAASGDATPESVRDATLSRAARLPPEGRAVLEAVSVFPRRANMTMVSTLAGEAFATAGGGGRSKGPRCGHRHFARHDRRAVDGDISPPYTQHRCTARRCGSAQRTCRRELRPRHLRVGIHVLSRTSDCACRDAAGVEARWQSGDCGLGRAQELRLG